MKKILINFTLVFLLLNALTLSAQAPQAVCYQAIATDINGLELINTVLTARISILQGSQVGSPIYVETHNKTTDENGLFTFEIGKGTLISRQPFHQIEWGKDKYYIKTEIDMNNINNFVTMGISQLISVPYALYANRVNRAIKADSATFALTANNVKTTEKALNDKDSDANNELQNLFFSNGVLKLRPAPAGIIDSIFIKDADSDAKNELQDILFNQLTGEISLTNPNGKANPISIYSGLFKRPAASLNYPLGVLGSYRNIGEGRYTVPAGKIFFVTAGPEVFKVVGFENGSISHRRLPEFPIFKEGTTIQDCKCTGFLTNTSPEITAVVADLQTSPVYQVPSGKDLIIKSGLSSDGYLIIDDILYQFLNKPTLSGSIILPQGTLIKKVPGTIDYLLLTGYLIPHNAEIR